MSGTHTLTWTLADAVEKMRAEAGMDQTELATASGVSRSSISNYERGTSAPPNFETIRRIARACDFHNHDEKLRQLWEDARESGCIYETIPLFDLARDDRGRFGYRDQLREAS